MAKQENPVFGRLKALVGEWEMEASVGGTVLARAKTDFKWLEDGAFLIQYSVAEPPLPTTPQVWIDNNPNPIVAIIGFDDYSKKFYYVYSDRRGVRRVYQMTLEGNTWKFWGQAGQEFYQRFEGKFREDGNTISGRIEKSTDGNNWELDFETKYTKINVAGKQR